MGTKRRNHADEVDDRRHGSSKRHHYRYQDDRYHGSRYRRYDDEDEYRRHPYRESGRRDERDNRGHLRENSSGGVRDGRGKRSDLGEQKAFRSQQVELEQPQQRLDRSVEQKDIEHERGRERIELERKDIEQDRERQKRTAETDFEQEQNQELATEGVVAQEQRDQVAEEEPVAQEQLPTQEHQGPEAQEPQEQQHELPHQGPEAQEPQEQQEVIAEEAMEVEGEESEVKNGEEGVPHTPEVQDLRFSPSSGACRVVDEFEKLGRLGEGTYGVVYQARDSRTGEVVALKRVKIHKEETEGFPITSLREINLLASLRHPCIIGVKEVVMGKNMENIFMVMEYCEMNLKDTMERLKRPYEFTMVKRMMQQLLSGVAYLHENWVLHRDIKPSNILVGSQGELKLCDFGLARRYDSPIKQYTHNVVTRWYRAPELFTKEPVKYSTAIDVWSLGCIMAELILNEPIFPGTSEIDQLKQIRKLIPRANSVNLGFLFPQQKMGSLRERILSPAAEAGRTMLSEKGFDLLAQLLTFDPERRISAREALNHPWFEEDPLPATAAEAAAFETAAAAAAALRKKKVPEVVADVAEV